MPRDSSGNYTLPLGNPVIDGTVIDVNWANPTMADIALQLNNVLTRDGLLAPLAPFYVVNGTPALPGLAFASNPGSGLWRDTTQVGISVAGVTRQVWNASGTSFPGTVTFSGTLALADDAPLAWGDGSANIKGNSTTDLLTLFTASAERMRIGAAGHIFVNGVQGLGLTGQFYHQVAGSYLAYGDAQGFRVLNTAATGAANLHAIAGTDGGGSLSSEGGPLIFEAGFTERARIDATGNVGIGTTNPVVGSAKAFVVNGTSTIVQARVSEVARAYLYADANLSTASFISTDYACTTPINSASTTFVNKASGLTVVDVVGGLFADTFRDIANPHFSAGIWFDRNPASAGLASASRIIFGTNAVNSAGALPTERMRIEADGRVLVGGIEVGYRGIPDGGGFAGTLTTDLNGKKVAITGAVTAPNGMTTDYTVTIYNMSGANQTISPGVGANLHLAGTALTGARTLADKGMCTLTYFNTANAIITGTGLT